VRTLKAAPISAPSVDLSGLCGELFAFLPKKQKRRQQVSLAGGAIVQGELNVMFWCLGTSHPHPDSIQIVIPTLRLWSSQPEVEGSLFSWLSLVQIP
jgi:hypothetical protein